MKASYATRMTTLPLSTRKALETQLRAVATIANEIKADHNAAMTKLDNDATVTGTDYNSLHATAAANVSLT